MERPAFELRYGFQILSLVYYFHNGFTNGTVASVVRPRALPASRRGRFTTYSRWTTARTT